MSTKRAQDWLAEGIEQHKQGRYAEAEACYKQVLALDPTPPAAAMRQDAPARSRARGSEALRSIREVLRQSLEAHS